MMEPNPRELAELLIDDILGKLNETSSLFPHCIGQQTRKLNDAFQTLGVHVERPGGNAEIAQPIVISRFQYSDAELEGIRKRDQRIAEQAGVESSLRSNADLRRTHFGYRVEWIDPYGANGFMRFRVPTFNGFDGADIDQARIKLRNVLMSWRRHLKLSPPAAHLEHARDWLSLPTCEGGPTEEQAALLEAILDGNGHSTYADIAMSFPGWKEGAESENARKMARRINKDKLPLTKQRWRILCGDRGGCSIQPPKNF